MSNTYLKKLEDIDIQSVQQNTLVDIKNVKIDTSLERAERISDFLTQIKNPYCFLCNGVIVKIGFTDTEDTLEEKLKGYFLSL